MTSLAGGMAHAEQRADIRSDELSILHVLAPAAVGGAESVVHALAAGQRDRGHDVRVAAVVGDDGPAHPFVVGLHAAGVDVSRLALGDRAYLRERARIADLCRRFRPDVVHTHGFRPDVVDAPVARRLGVPTLTTVHGFTGGGWRLRLYEHVQRRAFRDFDAVVAVSRPLAESLAAGGVRRERLHVVLNASANETRTLERSWARRALGMPDDAFVVGWVGRLSPEKGADTLIDAMALLRDVPVCIAVLGDGPDREMLAGRAAALGIADRIRWHGVVPNAASFFSAFDVFVLSSRTEGCPIVLLEAMAAHVPIVATCVGGVSDVVSTAHALLVRPADPGALADAVWAVYLDPARALLRARAAHERLRSEFSTDTWLDRYDALYRSIRRRAAVRG